MEALNIGSITTQYAWSIAGACAGGIELGRENHPPVQNRRSLDVPQNVDIEMQTDFLYLFSFTTNKQSVDDIYDENELAKNPQSSNDLYRIPEELIKLINTDLGDHSLKVEFVYHL